MIEYHHLSQKPFDTESRTESFKGRAYNEKDTFGLVPYKRMFTNLIDDLVSRGIISDSDLSGSDDLSGS